MATSLTFSLLAAPAAQPALVVLFGALFVASITDLRGRRIPNTLTFSAAVLGLGLHGLYGGLWPFLSSLLSFFCAFGVGFGLYSAFRGEGFGAGDAKMVMSCAALWGFWPAIWLFFASNLAMAFLYLPLRWIVQGTLLANLRGMGIWLLAILTAFAGRIGLGDREAHIVHFKPVGMEDKTPHAPFMLLGAILVLVGAKYGALPW
jgi:Flp pilus assembly protein protease CpaA